MDIWDGYFAREPRGWLQACVLTTEYSENVIVFRDVSDPIRSKTIHKKVLGGKTYDLFLSKKDKKIK